MIRPAVKLSAALLALVLSAPMDIAAPLDGEQLTKTEVSTAQATAAAELAVAPGYNTTTVDAVVVTADGDQPLLMVLDEDGKLLAWKWSQQVQPIEATALEFVRDLADERWVLVMTKLSLQLSEELSPADLERK